MLLQAIGGIVRPGLAAPKRPLWRGAHLGLGWLTLAIGEWHVIMLPILVITQCVLVVVTARRELASAHASCPQAPAVVGSTFGPGLADTGSW
jgi:hypothetical protein